MNLKSLLIGLAVVAVIGVIATIYNFGCPNEPRYPNTVVTHDTLVLERYNLKIDTLQNNILKNVVSKEVQPSIIYQEKITYRDIEKFKDYDLTLGFEKKGNTLRIFAVNMNDSLIKEQVFEDVYSNFSAWSANDKIVVKSNKFSFTGVKIYGETYLPVQNIVQKDFYKQANYRLGVEAGVDYKNKVELNLGIEKDFTTKDFQIKLKTSYKLN